MDHFLREILSTFVRKLFLINLKVSKRLSRNNLESLLLSDLNVIAQKKKNQKVLFVGAGGALEEFIKKIFPCNLVTIDVDGKRKPDFIMSISDLNFKDEAFDLVLMLEVLEHVDQPFNASSEILRVLKPEGILLLSTPFIFGIHDAPYDFWRFTKYGLMKLFERFDKLIIKERSGFLLTISTLLARLIICRNPFHRIIGCSFSLLFYILLPLINILDNILPKPITTGYYLKAKKK